MPHLVIPVHEASQVGEARRAAVRLAQELGFDEVQAGRVALVATELGTNLARHAQQGQLLVAARHTATSSGVEILSLDRGPGMADVNSCLQDGYSTGGTPGTGLGAIKRLADEFSVYSQPGHGTVIAARVVVKTDASPSPAPRFTVAAIAIAAPGEFVCGDGWAFHADGSKAAVMVADGLGHGPIAAEAAQAALAVFNTAHTSSPSQILERAHTLLKSTRGAAVAVTQLDAEAGTLVFSGAGNIAGRIISGVEDRSLLSQHGTVGLQIRRLQDVPYPWPDHAMLVLHSDGIVTRWTLADAPGLLQCDPILLAAWLIRDHCRGRDDATVVVIRRH